MADQRPQQLGPDQQPDIRDLYSEMWLRVLRDFVDAMLDAVIQTMDALDTPLNREQAVEAIERVRAEYIDNFRDKTYDV